MPTNLESIIAPSETGLAVPDPLSIETEESRKARYRQAIVKTQQGHGYRLKQFLLDLKRRFREVDRAARDEHLRQIYSTFLYFDGDMYREWNALGVLESLKREGDIAYSIPVLTGHVLEVFKQLLKVQIEWVFSAKDKSDENLRRLALMGEELGKEDLERLMKEDEEQTEILNAVLAGNSKREIYWSVNPKAPRKVKRIQYRREEAELPSRRECQGCMATVPEDARACPECGVTFIKTIQGGKTLKLIPEEVEVELGENCLRIPHPMAVQSDLSALRFDDSTYVIEHFSLDKHVASWAYQTLIEAGEGLSPEMGARQELERTTVQMSAIIGSTRWGQVATGTKVEGERHFWDAAEYGQFYCEVEEQLPDGTRIPAGTLLGDFYPDGAFVEYAGDTVIDVKPVRRRRRWVEVVYGKRPGSSVGQGAKLLKMLNDIINDHYNLYHGVVMTSARPYTVVAPGIKLLPQVGQYLRVEGKMPGQISDIRAAIAQYPGQTPAGIDPTSSAVQAVAQFTFGSYTLGPGGAADMQQFGKTATEVSARVEQAAGRQAGPIGQRIAADRETLFILLENIRDYSSPEQRKELEKRFGKDICEIFFGPEGTKDKGANFRQLLNIGIKPNSDIPRSMALTQAGMQAFAQSAGQLIQAAENAPWVMEFLNKMADAWGFPLELGQGRKDRREAEKRLNKLAAIEEGIQKKKPELLANPPEAAKMMYAALAQFCAPLITPTPDGQGMEGTTQDQQAARIFMQDHKAFMDAYEDEYFSEKASTFSEARKTVIIWLWLEHFKAGLGKQFHEAEMSKEIQQAMTPEPPEQPDPAQAQDEQDQRELMKGALEHAASEEAKDSEATRQDALAENAHDRALEMETHKADNQLAMAGAKPNGGGSE